MRVKKNEVEVKGLAFNREGKVFIKTAQCGIPFWILIVDGVRQSTFNDEKTMYISLDDLIKWYERETSRNSTSQGVEVDTIRGNLAFLHNLADKTRKVPLLNDGEKFSISMK